jgi:hypothetical protein
MSHRVVVLRSSLSPVRRGNYREQSIERCSGMSETVGVHRLTGLSALPTLVDLAGASVAAGAIARRRMVTDRSTWFCLAR